jgi:hypothetical protein
MCFQSTNVLIYVQSILDYLILFTGQDLYIIGGEYLLGYGNWCQSIWKYDVIREMWNFETRYSMYLEHCH